MYGAMRSVLREGANAGSQFAIRTRGTPRAQCPNLASRASIRTIAVHPATHTLEKDTVTHIRILKAYADPHAYTHIHTYTCAYTHTHTSRTSHRHHTRPHTSRTPTPQTHAYTHMQHTHPAEHTPSTHTQCTSRIRTSRTFTAY